MKSFFTKKYIRVPIALFVIVSLFLQFIPAPEPAKAWNPMDTLKKIFATIQVPSELELTKDGSFEFGGWLAQRTWGGSSDLSLFNCLFKSKPEPSGNSIDLKFCGCKLAGGLKCGWRDNNDCKAGCPNTPGCGGADNPCCVRAGEECVNPFSTFRFGHHESQTDLKTDDGRLTIPVPKVPDKCQLRIPLPDEDDTMSLEEKLAERKACNYFRRVQQSAAQLAYTAKKIFNNTDPLSECFFLRNCKTSCTLRFGKVSYTITLLDIIRLFVGDATVALNIVQKIVKLVRIFQKLAQLADAFKELLQEGVDILSNLLNAVKNVATLGSSLKKLGFNISHAFLFSLPSVITGTTQDEVTKGYNGFVQMINNFADNLGKYQTAKSEALALADQTREDANVVMEESVEITFAGSQQGTVDARAAGFKNEPEIGFLFVKQNTADTKDNYTKKKQIDHIVAQYQTMFKPISSLVDRMALLGSLYDGSSVGGRKTSAICDLYNSCDVNQSDCQACIEQYRVTEGSIFDEGLPHLKTDPNSGTIASTVVKYGLDIGTTTCPKLCLIKKPYPGDPDIFDFRAIPRDATYSISLNSYLLDPIYIRGRIEAALSSDEGDDGKLDHPKGAWRVYWESVARALWGDAWVDGQIDRDDIDMKETHKIIMDAVLNGSNASLHPCQSSLPCHPLPALQRIAALDERYADNISDPPDVDCNSYIVTACVEQQVGKYEAILNGVDMSLSIPSFGPATTHTEPWFDAFKEVARRINRLRAFVSLIKPEEIKKVIDKSLDHYWVGGVVGGTAKYSFKVLDDTKGAWVAYWQDLGRAVLEEGRVDYLLRWHRDPFGGPSLGDAARHNFIVEEVWKALNPAGDDLWFRTIADLDEHTDTGESCTHCTSNDCNKCDTPDEIADTIEEYAANMATSAPVRYDLIARTAGISQYINIVVQQKEDIETWWSAKPDPYWKVAAWCIDPAIGSQCTDILSQEFNKSYFSDLKDVDNWDERIDFLEISRGDIDIIVGALSYKISPLEPLLIYYIKRAKEKLIKYTELFKEVMRTLLEDLQLEIDNYCAAAQNTPAYKDYEKWLNYYKCYKNSSGNNCSLVPITPACDSWIDVHGCADCDECKANCEDNCGELCDKNKEEWCYKRYYDSGSTRKKCYDGSSSVSAKTQCRDKHDDWCNSHPEDTCSSCKKESATYDCPTTPATETYTNRGDCNDICKRPDCDTKSECEEHYCGEPANSNGACAFRDEYETKYKDELAKLNAECARREAYKNYLEHSNELNIDFDLIIESFNNGFVPLERAVKDLQAIWEEPVIADRESVIASSTIHRIIDTIKQSQDIVNNILPGIEAAMLSLSALDIAEKYLNIGYCGGSNTCTEAQGDDYRCKTGTYGNNCQKVSSPDTPEEVSKNTWDRLLFDDTSNPNNSGVIVKFRDEVATAKQQVVDFMKNKIGEYPSDPISNVPEVFLCPDNIDDLGFLNRIACFEKREIKRTFTQLPDFIKVVENFENAIFKIDEVKDSIIELEPSIELEKVGVDKDWKEKISENPISILDDVFNKIRVDLDAISFSPVNQNFGSFFNQAWIGIGHINVFGLPSDDRRDLYRNAVENLHDENMTDLRQLVFTDGDVSQGCNVLSPLINGDPQGVRANCEDFNSRSDAWLIGSEIDDFTTGHTEGCSDLEAIDLTLFEEGRDGDREDALIAERDALIAQREQVREIRCNDSALDDYLTCPEWICEGLADDYCVANASRRTGVAIWQTDTASPDYVKPADRKWPPRDPCKKGKADYTSSVSKHYLGAQTVCIQTQERLRQLQSILKVTNEFDWVTEDLINQCDTLAIEKSLKKECEHFAMLESKVFSDDCNDLRHCSSDETDAYIAGRVVAPCREYCESIREKIWRSFCVSHQPGIAPVLTCDNNLIFDDIIPNLTLPIPDARPREEWSDATKEEFRVLQEQRLAVIDKCRASSHNIQGPLDEIMKIFAILLGIKSATGLYSGIQVLKSGTQKIITDITKFKVMILGDGTDQHKGIIGDIKEIWKGVEAGIGGDGGGLKINPLICESHPAVSYTSSKDEKLTSSLGGPVCRGIGEFFQQIEAQFALMRQNVRNIDLSRKGVKEGGFSIGSLTLHLWDEYPIVYNSFNDIYTAAKNIKTSASYVWALANAVNFVNEQCVCGESYCKMPVCISGLPLAFAPIKNPYCYLVWIFRLPMKSVADRLGDLLEQQF